MGVEKDSGGWPILRAAREFTCDGKNPASDRVCLLGHHQGFHRDDTDAQWLDDGDLAKPDWLQ